MSSPPQRRWVHLDRAALVDTMFSLCLVGLAVIGFRTTFSGGEELAVGLPAVVAGTLVGLVASRLPLSFLTRVGIGCLGFFALAGAIAFRQEAAFGLLPTATVVRELIDGSVNGWVRLLTTVPPAGQAGNLLAVPYLVGFAGAAASVGLATVRRRGPHVLVPAAVVLAVAILFGTDRPASLLLQGAVFAGVAIAWVAARDAQGTSVVTTPHRAPRTGRLVAAALVLAGAGAVGLVVGPRLPFSGSQDRYVLRDRVQPPFDPLVHPSPLVGYRRFAGQDAPLREKTLLTLRGLPAGARVRLGVLDSFDGLVWRASGDGSAAAGSFLRVGDPIPNDARGATATIEVEVGELSGVWLPVVDSVNAIRFEGPRERELTDSFRFNRETESAAVPAALAAGDRYAMDVTIKAPPDAAVLATRALATGAGPDLEVPPAIAGLTADILAGVDGGPGNPYGQVAALSDTFRTGAYSDGGRDQKVVVPPGHSLARLARFLQAEQLVGNGEQYAAAMAFVLRTQGIPARVVMGFVPTSPASSGTVTVRGEDVATWVEVPFDGAGWIPFDATPTKDRLPNPAVDPVRNEERPENQPPPPTTIAPPSELGDDVDVEPPPPPPEDPGGLHWILRLVLTVLKLALIPLVLIAGPMLAVSGLKARRRARRRTRGQPAQRASAAWYEVLDLARDLDRPVPSRSTRVEASRFLDIPGSPDLAASVDAAVFGEQAPTDPDVDAIWSSVDRTRTAVLTALPPIDRARATLTLTSLRKHR